jgi:hypothetical protein
MLRALAVPAGGAALRAARTAPGLCAARTARAAAPSSDARAPPPAPWDAAAAPSEADVQASLLLAARANRVRGGMAPSAVGSARRRRRQRGLGPDELPRPDKALTDEAQAASYLARLAALAPHWAAEAAAAGGEAPHEAEALLMQRTTLLGPSVAAGTARGAAAAITALARGGPGLTKAIVQQRGTLGLARLLARPGGDAATRAAAAAALADLGNNTPRSNLCSVATPEQSNAPARAAVSALCEHGAPVVLKAEAVLCLSLPPLTG